MARRRWPGSPSRTRDDRRVALRSALRILCRHRGRAVHRERQPRLRLCRRAASSTISGRTTSTISASGGAPRRPPTRPPRPMGDGHRFRCAGRGGRHRLGLLRCRLPGARLRALPDLDVAGRRRRARDPRIRPRHEELREGRLLLAGLQVGAVLVRRRHADPAAGLHEEEQTTSGYPRSVKLWKRGTPVEKAETIYEAEAEDRLGYRLCRRGR